MLRRRSESLSVRSQIERATLTRVSMHEFWKGDRRRVSDSSLEEPSCDVLLLVAVPAEKQALRDVCEQLGITMQPKQWDPSASTSTSALSEVTVCSRPRRRWARSGMKAQRTRRSCSGALRKRPRSVDEWASCRPAQGADRTDPRAAPKPGRQILRRLQRPDRGSDSGAGTRVDARSHVRHVPGKRDPRRCARDLPG